jgi:hypothetical protein
MPKAAGRLAVPLKAHACPHTPSRVRRNVRDGETGSTELSWLWTGQWTAATVQTSSKEDLNPLISSTINPPNTHFYTLVRRETGNQTQEYAQANDRILDGTSMDGHGPTTRQLFPFLVTILTASEPSSTHPMHANAHPPPILDRLDRACRSHFSVSSKQLPANQVTRCVDTVSRTIRACRTRSRRPGIPQPHCTVGCKESGRDLCVSPCGAPKARPQCHPRTCFPCALSLILGTTNPRTHTLHYVPSPN